MIWICLSQFFVESLKEEHNIHPSDVFFCWCSVVRVQLNSDMSNTTLSSGCPSSIRTATISGVRSEDCFFHHVTSSCLTVKAPMVRGKPLRELASTTYTYVDLAMVLFYRVEGIKDLLYAMCVLEVS